MCSRISSPSAQSHVTFRSLVQTTLTVSAYRRVCCSPPTALRMLEEYVALQPGDTVVQNGANSAVGRNVIQLCKAAGASSLLPHACALVFNHVLGIACMKHRSNQRTVRG